MTLLVPLSLTLLLSIPSGFSGGYKVVAVKDGDTVKVEKSGKVQTVRLACIDAPEKGQLPYGASSFRALSNYLPVGATVGLRTIAVDKYGRQVSEVFKSNISINVAMVKSGNAFVYRSFLKNCNVDVYDDAEKIAHTGKLGVWADSPNGIIRPWVWRRTQTPSPTVTCKSLGSRQKAIELYNSGHTYLDRNNDGIPCN